MVSNVAHIKNPIYTHGNILVCTLHKINVYFVPIKFITN